MIVSVPFYGIAWSNEFDAGKGSKSERGLGPEVWVGRWDSWKTSMTRLWPVVVLENFGAIERTPKTWIAGPGACRNNIHKEAHMLKSTCNPRQETQETQETRILHGENDDDWITESVLCFFASEGMDIHGDWDSNAKTAANWSSPKPQEQRSKTFQALLWHLTVSIVSDRFRLQQSPGILSISTKELLECVLKTFALLQFSTLKVNYQDWPSDLSGHSIFDFTHELRQQAVFEANLLIGGQLSWQRGDKMRQWNQLILDS